MSDATNDTPQGDGRLVGLVLMLSENAMMALGKLVNPATGTQETNLEQARVFIDLVEMLEEKTRGNLNSAEETFLQTHLTNLRLNFVNESGPRASDARTKKTRAAEPPRVVEVNDEGQATVVDKRAASLPDEDD